MTTAMLSENRCKGQLFKDHLSFSTVPLSAECKCFKRNRFFQFTNCSSVSVCAELVIEIEQSLYVQRKPQSLYTSSWERISEGYALLH
jgi:hypothetical protein